MAGPGLEPGTPCFSGEMSLIMPRVVPSVKGLQNPYFRSLKQREYVVEYRLVSPALLSRLLPLTASYIEVETFDTVVLEATSS